MLFRRIRRALLRDAIIHNGKRLRELETSRAGIDPDTWPDDFEYLSTLITHHRRRHSKLLAKFKDTNEED